MPAGIDGLHAEGTGFGPSCIMDYLGNYAICCASVQAGVTDGRSSGLDLSRLAIVLDYPPVSKSCHAFGLISIRRYAIIGLEDPASRQLLCRCILMRASPSATAR